MINYLIGSIPILYESVGPCHKVVTKKGQFSEILENGEGFNEQSREAGIPYNDSSWK